MAPLPLPEPMSGLQAGQLGSLPFDVQQRLATAAAQFAALPPKVQQEQLERLMRQRLTQIPRARTVGNHPAGQPAAAAGSLTAPSQQLAHAQSTASAVQAGTAGTSGAAMRGEAEEDVDQVSTASVKVPCNIQWQL